MGDTEAKSWERWAVRGHALVDRIAALRGQMYSEGEDVPNEFSLVFDVSMPPSHIGPPDTCGTCGKEFRSAISRSECWECRAKFDAAWQAAQIEDEVRTRLKTQGEF